jgi:hypothetical protein
MPFNMSYDSIPQISTFEAARERYETTKPIKGRANDGIRPVGGRNRPQYSIDKKGDNYVIRCHASDLVTFCPDGEILATTNGWDTNLTADFINITLGDYIPRIHRYQGWIWIYASHKGKMGMTRLSSHVTTFKAVDGRLEVLNPAKMGYKKLNIKRLNAVKKQYAALYAYVDRYVTMMRVDRDDKFAYLPVGEGDMTIRSNLRSFVDETDPAKLYEALRVLQFGWTNKGRGGCVSRKTLNDMIRFTYQSMLYDVVPLEYGKQKEDCFALPE